MKYITSMLYMKPKVVELRAQGLALSRVGTQT